MWWLKYFQPIFKKPVRTRWYNQFILVRTETNVYRSGAEWKKKLLFIREHNEQSSLQRAARRRRSCSLSTSATNKAAHYTWAFAASGIGPSSYRSRVEEEDEATLRPRVQPMKLLTVRELPSRAVTPLRTDISNLVLTSKKNHIKNSYLI